MEYVAAVLAPGERILHVGRLHWVYWLRAVAALVFLGVIVIGVIWFLRDLAFIFSTRTVLTDQRLIEKRGLIARHAREMQLAAVEVVEVDQGLWGRLLGFGRVSVHGAGGDVWESPMIVDPLGFRRNLEVALGALARPRAP